MKTPAGMDNYAVDCYCGDERVMRNGDLCNLIADELERMRAWTALEITGRYVTSHLMGRNGLWELRPHEPLTFRNRARA